MLAHPKDPQPKEPKEANDMDGNKFARRLTQMARDEFATASTDFEYAGNKLTKRAIRHYGMALGLLEAARQVPFQPIAAHDEYDSLDSEWRNSEFATQYRKHTIIDGGPKHESRT